MSEVKKFFVILILINLTLDSTSSGVEKCGRSTAGIGNVIRGETIARGVFPWYVAITTIQDEYFCGGTLVSKRKVISAAHCFHEKNADQILYAKDIKLHLGVYRLSASSEVGRTISAVEKIELHPEWNPNIVKHDADIAILTLDQDAPSTAFIRPICLHFSEDLKSFNSGHVIGYGLNEHNEVQDLPKYLQIPIHTNEDCWSKFDDLNDLGSKRTFCGGYGNGTGVCKGDSGGGVFIKVGNTYYLRGIVSASILDDSLSCDVHAYAIFTDILPYKTWILGTEQESFPIGDRTHVQLKKYKEKFLTILIPKVISHVNDFRAFIIPHGIEESFQVRVGIGSIHKKIDIKSDKFEVVDIPKGSINRTSSQNIRVKVTLKKNSTAGDGSEQCISRVLQQKFDPTDGLRLLIQTDKPAYNPKESVKLRILVLDNEFKPTSFDTWKVEIYDTVDRLVETFKNNERNQYYYYSKHFKDFEAPEKESIDVIEKYFVLAEYPPLGTWKIKVTVKDVVSTKQFIVQKGVLSDLRIDLSAKLSDTTLKVDFGAKYYFDEIVRGKAELIIRGINNNHLYSTNNFDPLIGQQSISYDIRRNFKISSAEPIDLMITFSFTEHHTGIIASKNATVTINEKPIYKIRVHHPENFVPGKQLLIESEVFKQRNEKLINHEEMVYITLKMKLENSRHKRTLNAELYIQNGVAIDEFLIPPNVENIELEVSFMDAMYKKKIGKGKINMILNELVVTHKMKSVLNQTEVEITVSNTTAIDNIILLFVSRLGNIECHHVNCDYHEDCKFTTKINQKMMPKVTATVFYIKDNETIHQGSTEIHINSLSDNYLYMDIDHHAIMGQRVNITFESKPNSTIYLLAIDERLINANDKSEISKDDIVREVPEYDGQNEVISFDLNNWNDCISDDLTILEEGRRSKRSSFSLFEEEDEEEEETDVEIPLEDHRHNFPVTWIFEKFKIAEDEIDNIIIRNYIVPDSITTWKLNAFATNLKYGLAIAETKQLIVKNEFYIKINYPDSIRYEEVFRLDILVFNYIKTGSSVDVDVTLKCEGSAYQLIEYDESCKPTFINTEQITKTTTVESDNMEKVSFYIRPISANDQVPETLTIRVKASTKDGVYKDKVKEFLKVEPIKLALYKTNVMTFRLSENLKIWQERFDFFFLNNFTLKLPKIVVLIEPIIHPSNKMDLTVVVDNENQFKETIHITKDDSWRSKEIYLPDNSLAVNFTVSGSGSCHILMISEYKVLFRKLYKYFTVNIMILDKETAIMKVPTLQNDQKLIKVCANFTQTNYEENSYDLKKMWVFYDIDIPSGYVYVDIIDLERIRQNIEVLPRNRNTKVIIHFDEFMLNEIYCITVLTRKVADVKTTKNAVVYVYDYEMKDHIALAYYNIDQQCKD